MSAERHIVVLGGGIAGLGTAAALASEPGVRVTLVERETHHGAHSSGRSAEIQRSAIDDPVTRALALRTDAMFDEEAARGTDLVMRRGLVVATDAQPAWRDELIGRGDACEIQGDTLRTLLPHARLVGNHAFHFPHAGQVRVQRLIAMLARRFEAADGVVRRSSGSARIELDAGRVAKIALPGRETIACDDVVVAAGAWSLRIAEFLGAPLPLRPTLRHMFRVRSDRTPSPDATILWDDAASFYVRPDGDGWVCSICDTTDADPGRHSSASYAVQRDVEQQAMERLHEVAPDVARGASVTRAWTGYRDLSPDDRPILGPDGRVDGLSWCVGLGGHGMTISLAVGETTAAAVLGAENPHVEGCAARRMFEGRLLS